MCGKVGVDDVGLYLGERWCLILVAKLTVGWMVEWDLYSHQEQWGQQICWHGDEFWDSHKGAGWIQSRSSEILMYHSLKVFHGISICAHLIFVGLYLQGGACLHLFDLVCPQLMSIHPYLHLLSLMCSQIVLIQPLLVCWFAFVGWCLFMLVHLVCPQFGPVHPCLHLFSLMGCQSVLFWLLVGLCYHLMWYL